MSVDAGGVTPGTGAHAWLVFLTVAPPVVREVHHRGGKGTAPGTLYPRRLDLPTIWQPKTGPGRCGWSAFPDSSCWLMLLSKLVVI